MSITGEGSEMDEMFKDAPLYFDPGFPPMDRWTRNQQKKMFLVILKLEL